MNTHKLTLVGKTKQEERAVEMKGEKIATEITGKKGICKTGESKSIRCELTKKALVKSAAASDEFVKAAVK